jgi:hypothetical protein
LEKSELLGRTGKASYCTATKLTHELYFARVDQLSGCALQLGAVATQDTAILKSPLLRFSTLAIRSLFLPMAEQVAGTAKVPSEGTGDLGHSGAYDRPPSPRHIRSYSFRALGEIDCAAAGSRARAPAMQPNYKDGWGNPECHYAHFVPHWSSSLSPPRLWRRTRRHHRPRRSRH